MAQRPMRLTESDPFETWSRQVHELLDEMLHRTFVTFRRPGTWHPAVNVYETREAYFVCADIAGIDRQQVQVARLEPNRLVITGRRCQPRPPGVRGPLSVWRMEIHDGVFHCEVNLPEAADLTRLEVAYREGYLWIRIPRTTTTGTRR